MALVAVVGLVVVRGDADVVTAAPPADGPGPLPADVVPGGAVPSLRALEVRVRATVLDCTGEPPVPAYGTAPVGCAGQVGDVLAVLPVGTPVLRGPDDTVRVEVATPDLLTRRADDAAAQVLLATVAGEGQAGQQAVAGRVVLAPRGLEREAVVQVGSTSAADRLFQDLTGRPVPTDLPFLVAPLRLVPFAEEAPVVPGEPGGPVEGATAALPDVGSIARADVTRRTGSRLLLRLAPEDAATLRTALREGPLSLLVGGDVVGFPSAEEALDGDELRLDAGSVAGVDDAYRLLVGVGPAVSERFIRPVELYEVGDLATCGASPGAPVPATCLGDPVLRVERVRDVRVREPAPGDFLEATVEVTMNEADRQVWAEWTTENVGEQVALVVDGQVLSAPHINEPITRGPLLVTPGQWGEGDAEALYERLLDRPTG